MSKTKKSDQLRTLRIGNRVRCTDDGATGTITWANGVSVKIKWDDGELVTWKRDSLPDRPIQIVDTDNETKPEATAPETASAHAVAELATDTTTNAAQAPVADARPESDASNNTKAKAPSKRQRKATAEPKKTSALDAAARVLQEYGQAMNCQELIEAMSAKGYWTSPGGKTPQATLYSAILRELKTKGQDARFRKAERGKFERTVK